MIGKGAILEFTDLTHPYKAVCDNCLNTYIVYQTEDGIISYQCPVCGAKIRIHKLSRYHFVKELRYPKSKKL